MKEQYQTVPYSHELMPLAASFSSGNAYIDKFLRDSDSLNDNIGKTYVWLSRSRKEIIGYYNIGTGYVCDDLSGKTYKIGGSIHINYLALDERLHYHKEKDGKVDTTPHISDFLLHDCLSRIEALRKYVGFAFITLSSTRKGYLLYSRHGFEPLEEDMWFESEENKSSMFDSDDGECTDMFYTMDLEV